MALFSGLEGVASGQLHGPVVMGGHAAMKSLLRYRVVSGAGDFGAWTVTQVRAWLKEFIPKCHGINQ